ncbi:TonB-dependent receptor [Spirosoma sp.]|uniref:SusC/RagA family TonB-linked outer membrane protein n=1 Tax=Spirosoma sp. TaxID=1899569 RepID=UPI00262B4EFD|nr:TonB-dependent receptor [Spirosoma sp.]MCX6219230.1 TonB-dependent receptor [Spirosoma sp.]
MREYIRSGLRLTVWLTFMANAVAPIQAQQLASALTRQKPLAAMAVSTSASVQLVTGRVTDETGTGLPGANVTVKGTTTGTATDEKGQYRISVPTPNAVLVFSSVGYLKQEVSVGNRTTVDIQMRVDNQSLSEVVVIGYGEQSRKTLSTAIAKVEGKNIGIQPVSTPGEALAALAAGVQVQSDRGSTPGAPPTIRIRGVGSLSTGSTPLYVVDGYPLQDPAQFALINPTDIESMEILKDAASAAIYGSRAANGVVIVTTKRGKAGKTSFNVSIYTGIQQLAKKVQLLNRDQYIENAIYASRLKNIPYPKVFETKPDSLPDTDWQDAIFRQATISNYQLSATGGTDKVRFAISGGYFKQDGILKGSAYERYNLRFNLDADLSPKLKLGVSMAPSYSSQFQQQAAGQFNGSNGTETSGTRSLPSAIISAIDMPPTIPVYTPNGDYAQTFNGNTNPNGTNFYQTNLYNPLAVLELSRNNLKGYRLFGNGFLEWQPIANLRLKTTLGSTLSIFDQSAYIPANLANESAPRANSTNPVLGQIFARESQTVTLDWLWENTATYNKAFGNHNFSLLALYSLQKLQAKNTATSGRSGSYTTSLLDNPLASPDRIGELNYDQNAFLSLGGRITYDFKSKYIFSAAIRRDASSRFGPNNRFATFPSISGAWRISEEKFWSGLKNSISELKIRASYGETGNANIGSFNWTNSVQGRNYSFNQARTFGYAQTGFANYDLTWEKNVQTDLGLEMGFLNDRFTLGIDYYNRLTTGMLFQKDLPGIVGYATNFRTNIGSLRNRGLELSARANLNVGAVRWTIDGNISGNRSKVMDLGGPASLPTVAAIFGWNNVYQVRVGDPLGNMYGFQVTGIFKNADDLSKNAQFTTGDKVGNWMIRDQNGDNKIDENDRVYIGKGVPSYIWGMTHNFQYKNFDLSVILQGVQGVNVINGNLRHIWANQVFNTIPLYFRNQFDPANPTQNTDFPAAGAGGIHPGNNLTDRLLFDGSFVRIRNLTFGYSVPTVWLNKIKLQSARIYVTGQNLFTFTSYPWYNPETNTVPDSPVQIGVDQGTYPLARTYTIGLNIGF